MRGQILLKALEILEEGVCSQIDFFNAVLSSGYGASMGKIDYEYNKLRNSAESKNIIERKRKLRLFISQMRYDGLIQESEDYIKISNKGKQKITKLKNRLPDRHYQLEKQKCFIVISFDIPEKFRRKRNWLREVIKNLGFEMIHQSVWIGKVKIPNRFISDLEKMKILEYVEIFEITKTGSLKNLNNI